MIPTYVYHAYNVTHSLVIFAAAFALVWMIRRKCPWVMGAWGLHILLRHPHAQHAIFSDAVSLAVRHAVRQWPSLVSSPLLCSSTTP